MKNRVFVFVMLAAAVAGLVSCNCGHKQPQQYALTVEALVGADMAKALKDATIGLYSRAADYALGHGIIIADTKFEFGLDEDGNIVVADEMLTPDSSRFWPVDGYEPGHGQPSFDKQFVRDYLKANPDCNYDLPQDVIDKTIAKYLEAYKLLTGEDLQ